MKRYSSLSLGPIEKGRAGAVPMKINIRRRAKVDGRREEDDLEIALPMNFRSGLMISRSPGKSIEPADCID